MAIDYIIVYEDDSFTVEYDRENNRYRVSYFEDYHYKNECCFSAHKEKELKNNLNK